MGLLELFICGIALSMDAFAVSVCKGLSMRKVNVVHALIIALFFGGFQAGMPLIGYLLGSLLAPIVTPIDHWIAFALLAIIGGKMLKDAIGGEEDDDSSSDKNSQKDKLNYKELVLLAIATSIDALALGITFAFLQVNIWIAIILIGCTTFILSFMGVCLGNFFGSRWEKPATIAGGVTLILLGCKILLEHLGILL